MRIYPLKHGEGKLLVMARNLKTCKKEMKIDFPSFKYMEMVNMANNITGELGLYYFKKININGNY